MEELTFNISLNGRGRWVSEFKANLMDLANWDPDSKEIDRRKRGRKEQERKRKEREERKGKEISEPLS